MLKKLSPSERRLVLLSASTAFIVLNLIFLPKLMAGNRAAKQKHTELKAELTAAESWIAKEAYWAERKKWLEETEPELNAAREDSATQFEQLQASARKFGLKIDEVQLLQLPETEFYQPIGAQLVVTGPWPGLVQFIAKLQDPLLFDVIPRFHIKSDQEPPNVQCELQVQRWFHKPRQEAP